MLEITLTITRLEKIAGKKSAYKIVSNETKMIDERMYNNITSNDTIKFFRRLGGTETVQKSYTCEGYICTKLISTSPNKENKTVREFKFKYV